MSVVLNDNPSKKVEYVLKNVASGKTNKEIAQEMGYKDVHNLYVFMRRRGLEWSPKKRLFVVSGDKKEEEMTQVIEDNPSGKVGSIISMFNKKMDGKEIAKSLRFSSYKEMADYMKSKGYLWDNEKQNYVKTVVKVEDKPQKETSELSNEEEAREKAYQCNCIEKYGNILKLLETNKDRLSELFKSVDESEQTLPRYVLSGFSVTKSIDISRVLDQLIKDYSNDKNVSQKEIVQVALIEFFKQHGYANEVKSALKV